MKVPYLPKKFVWLLPVVILVGTALILAACGSPEEEPMSTPTPCPECPECPEVECPEEPVIEIPFADAWAMSPHADATSESFTHWDEDDPAEVPPSCAKCHSTPGYQDYLGADGSEAGVVDSAAEIGTVVNCVACHNEAAMMKTSVVFPSGVEVMGLGDEARCMECHQGRASTTTVNDAIAEAGVDADTVSEDLGFINIHYYAAAATQLGGVVHGGFEYEGKSYDVRFDHVDGYDACIDCHDPHTLELKLAECQTCHTDVADAEGLKDLRLVGSTADYDGDGDVEEGVYYEIQGLQEILYGALQTYASDVAGTALVYDSHSYPYFFIDTNENGEADEDEANYGNQYNAWTPRLVKAAYNYQTSLKDPGAYAHGGKYIIQLLYDSIEDLDEGLVAGLARTDVGHFAGSEEAWRHWDEDEPAVVSGRCAKCHSADGLPFYLMEGTNVSQEPSNGMMCTTCHVDATTFELYTIEDVDFPSGATLALDDASNICLECHQGRQSTASVNGEIAGLEPDAVSEDLGFVNVHYFAAGATLFGTEAQGAYEYEGQTYAGRFAHVEGFDTCIECHSAHNLAVQAAACEGCHAGAEEDIESIRIAETDFDGDGDAGEGLAGEIETIHEALYAAIQAYANDTAGTPIVYDAHAYPYWFIDTNENGEADPDEANYGNQYNAWTPTLLQAAYNYQYAAKDPGAFAHNGTYIIQVLYDSLENIGGDTAGMTRPEVAETP
jgi:hypothetical protein